MAAGIYVLRNLITGDEYVGQTAEFGQRFYDHVKDLRGGRHVNRHLKFAALKYGYMAFAFEVLEVVDNLQQLDEREVYWGELLKPQYNLAPFGQQRRNWTGKSYTLDTEQRVTKAFHQLAATGQVVMPGDVARLAGVCSNCVWRVFKDAEWWTEDRQKAMRQEAWRRALATQEAKGWNSVIAATAKRVELQKQRPPRPPKKGYSPQRAEHVLSVYYQLVWTEPVVTLVMLSDRSNTGRQYVRRILRDHGLWNDEMQKTTRTLKSKLIAKTHRPQQLLAMQRGRDQKTQQRLANQAKLLELLHDWQSRESDTLPTLTVLARTMRVSIHTVKSYLCALHEDERLPMFYLPLIA